MKIVNCSSIQLTPSQIALLKRGLKFTPTPKASNHTELAADIKSFSRRMRLNEYFHNKDYSQESILRKPSYFTPAPGREESLDNYCDFLSNLASNLDSIPTNTTKDNLTRFERSALQELRELIDSYKIVIMPADKGGAVVVLEADHYKRMVESVFYDPQYFEGSDGNQMKSTINKINALCRKYSSELTKDEINYISRFDYKEANFYGLPKIHKSALIKQATKEQKSEVVVLFCPDDLKIRPIVGGPASPTSHLSELVDHLLKPFMMNLPSYVKDSRDLLRQADTWESEADEEYTLITMDISAMYMNISESLGAKAISHFVTNNPELLHSRFSLEFVLDAIKIVLNNNVSFFDGHYQRQIHGCAMGSHDSPPYSSLAVGYIESVAYENLLSSQGIDYADYFKKMLRRFLDDVFIKWKLSLGSPTEMYNVMNNIDPMISFTMESGNSIPFLDVRFTLRPNGSLATDIYYKETDSHNYVPFSSFHPHKTLTNIPYTLARRICTIVSEPDIRDTRLQELRTFLQEKRYPKSVIDSGINRALQLNRAVLLEESNPASDSSNLPFVFTNNCANPNVLESIRKAADIMLPSDRMREVMSDKKIIAAKRQPRNIRSMLFRPRFQSNQSTQSSSQGSVSRCRDDPNRVGRVGQPCRCCDFLNICTSITFEGSSQSFEIRHHFTCDTSNLIYALTCGTCGANYIGQTERPLRERCGDYRRAVNSQNFSQGVHEHLSKCGNGIFSMTPFFKIKGNTDHSTILTYEDMFIKKYKPRLNHLKLGC